MNRSVEPNEANTCRPIKFWQRCQSIQQGKDNLSTNNARMVFGHSATQLPLDRSDENMNY